MSRDLLVENIRYAAAHDEPLTLSVVEVATLNAELDRLVREVSFYRAETERLRDPS